jgi:hypothetical protein
MDGFQKQRVAANAVQKPQDSKTDLEINTLPQEQADDQVHKSRIEKKRRKISENIRVAN